MFEMWLLAQVIDVAKLVLSAWLVSWAIVPAIRAMRKK